MFKMIVLVLSLLGLLHSGVGQVVQYGQCNPNINLANNFNVTNFLGKWYEFRTTDTGSGDCSSLEFASTNESITVSRYGVNENFEENRSGSLGATESPKLEINWGDSQSLNFWVLSTDDTQSNFTLIYDCINISPVQRSVSILLLQRIPTPLTPIIMSMINTTLNNQLQMTLSDLRTVQHSEVACTVLPVIPPGNPIVLPGQCDPDIRVVQNFNVSAFTGLWHEVASYVSENSANQCSRAEYTLSGSVVNVVNSQVINQTLDTITGTATVISTNGSAQLEVILNVAENTTVTQELYVLATDYTSYAISYSCFNLSNDTKRVFSWILSRTRRLSESAEISVNEAIASELVLNNLYYQPTNQTDESCFFYPEPVPGVPVKFRGSCDMNIPVVMNFNASAYMGTWHDIESYPSIFQTGDCKNANYDLGEVVSVINTQVINQSLDTTIGFAVPSTNDTSAKLEVTFPIPGVNVSSSTKYWVLATDYTSYALVYSCVDIVETEDRQVWAWKLSRTKQLTESASININNVVASIPVLDQRYFQQVDQSPEGCFYFPEPEPGVPVRFPGQCNETIPVVQNFNISLFENVWHEIEAYPKLQQEGQCINHVYTATSDNTLSLQSWQIVDQFLNISNGTLGFNSTDNSAKMTITLPNLGIEIPFWILLTDYNSYALAYSCINLDADFRAVYSWKLSRTKQLSENAATEINNVINSVEVLGQKYYEPIDQSDKACFYLPELSPGEPVILVGQCDPNITVVQNFNASRYLGRWRLIEGYPSDFQNGSCNQATYTLNPNSTVDVYNTQVNNNTLVTINGIATIVESGKLEVLFPDAPSTSDYWVLDTDYDSYSLVYSCRNINSEQRRIWSWKLSRTPSLTPQADAAINEKINTIDVLNNRYFEKIDHTDEGCFYFPEPRPDTPVRFRGRCDQNIPAVPNFNVTRYLGLWHNIELYPSPFQEGTCSNALYSAGPDGVIVYNTQVVDQTLDTTTGLAVVAFPDGSGKLNVTFPVAGTNFTITTNYWVLDTDYDSYSIVYTCNEEEEYRQVYSWKLSRTKQLTAAAVAAINNVTSGIQVLDERYYFDSDQSAEGCFYFPEPQPGVPVVFPGQCSSNINVVQNFNLSRFEGIWHEIEAYPKEQQQGHCVNHEYTSGTGNTLNLQSSQVSDLSLSINRGVLSFASTDNSARMSITINVNGTDFTIPFWILSTDYDDHALAYSCVNQGSDYRAVYSWKLSRTKSLSESATTAINNVVATVDVLRQRYYEPIDQSDNACFYFPDLAPGEPVVLVGQCESNISVVQNFNASRYLGRWRLIEGYPSDFQNGSCNQATYTLNANSTVDVYNTQVNNNTLVTINGIATIVESGKLEVLFPDAPSSSDYWVLDTDYDSYSLVYSCRNINAEQRRIWSWKLSRTPSLTPQADAAINEKINTIDVLNNRYFEKIDHTDEGCFYFPEPRPDTPVRFRGRCDQDIPAVPNFNVTRYLGLWHNIELYPSPFQEGTCSNALYSAGPDGVIVYNTQVVDQTLDTTTGLAVVAFPDGSGKLNVTFPVAGTNFTITTNYWVLDTDYDSYSIVYTCNEEEEYRQVYSWKLSRTKQLTAAAVAAINNVTSGIQVLDERYYFDSDQSAEGCFYFPEPQPGVPVVFPGQCSSNINVVQNFNLSRFEGIWHEIEAYPKEQQQGHCVNHEYTSGTGNTLNLQSSQVSDLSLSINRGVLSFASTDNSARMSITINVNGTDFTIPFWILSTDYDDHALAYSCVNQGSDYRAVYSWKLSRTKTLSNASNIVINQVMSDVDVLRQEYYESINQSDEACFYLPELGPGEPVVFPGQCDETIPTVPNFEPTRYLGRWRTIATYESDFQGGTCGQATYSLAEDGQTVIVYNTQVLRNQTFDEIYGTAQIVDGAAKLLVNFTTAPQLANYWILATDYSSYSLVYSCRNINPEQRQVWSWKLSRDRVLSPAANDAINAVINSIDVLNEKYYDQLEQTEEACFYYPEVTGQPVVYRGRCNDSLPVVTNFNATMYQGLWYDIESYPLGFQFGTCPTATYTLNGDVVDVYNTQVFKQQLDVISATAVFANNDDSAKLNVTFPVAGTDLFITSPYWVLDTDYTNYSLVYSCMNIDEEYYRVFSWKLSRSKQLSDSASNVIAQATSTVKELRQQYYIERGHSEEDCFFYPDNNGGPVILDGECESDDEIDVVNNFDHKKFSGSWFEINHFPSEIQGGQCVSSQYVDNENGFTVTMSFVNDERLTTYTGSAILANLTRGILDINISSDSGQGSISGSLYILDTDYTDYALTYSCRPISSTQKQVYSWKLSRSRAGLSPNANGNIDAIVSSRKDLFENYYVKTGQDSGSCFYYPEFEAIPTSIILPGYCDTSIKGIANFNPTSYLGRWYEINRYPQADQFGECSQATYSSGAGVVDVVNTQVVNRTLLTQAGNAVVASTDGTGLLTVTFVVGGETRTASYYILDTDYTSYSLVYSCRNLDVDEENFREVFSWKLSRTKTLSGQANTNIANVINVTQGLLEKYYIPTSQSDESCFYVPEFKPDEAVHFRGRCEQVSSGITNFDNQRYLNGWWHEIERYPSDNSGGDCVSTHYDRSGNQVGFTDTRVFNNDGSIATGTVTAQVNGQITKTYSDGNREQIWVLATDYDSYSLLLSCENIDDEYIRVWSTKHSRTRNLSQASQNAMAQVIQANDLLYQEFYLPVSQTDNSCFFYPAANGQQVILPGQCDANIPVESAFDIDAYTGTWYQTERYPYPEISADSECIGTRYTLDDATNIIHVINWENVDGEVKSIEGQATWTDGSAILTVVLPNIDDPTVNATTDLYVLKTDHTTYSLVYTCSNLDEYHRVVVALKLSRTRQMPASGTTEINNYMAQRPELNQNYFIQVEQNDDCEDPSSAFLYKSSVIMIMVCLLINAFF